LFQENTATSALILPREPQLCLEHAQRCIFLIIEQSCGPVAVEMFQESTVISAPILQKQRELSLAHVQRCNFLIMEQSSGPLAVEIVIGKQEKTASLALNF
jgi:hypothetical protein